MSRYTVDIQCGDGIKVGQFVADNGRKMSLDEIVDRLNKYENLADLVRPVFPNIKNPVNGSWTVPASNVRELMKRIEALTPKTEAELLEERLMAADVLLRSISDRYMDHTIQDAMDAYVDSCKAHKAAKS